MSCREVVHLGRDNEIVLALDHDGVLDASAVTRVELEFRRPGAANIELDSAARPELFTLGRKAVVRGVEVGVLVLKLGGAPLPQGLYSVDVYLYDAVADDGLYWDSLEVLVVDGQV